MGKIQFPNLRALPAGPRWLAYGVLLLCAILVGGVITAYGGMLLVVLMWAVCRGGLCLLLPAAFAGGEVTAAAPAISFYALCAADPAAWMAADAVLMIPFLRDIMRKWQ